MSDTERPDGREVAAAPKRPAADAERTHLLLDAVCLDEDDSAAGKEQPPRAEPPSTSAGAASAAGRATAADEARTHLLLDPVALDEADGSPRAVPAAPEEPPTRVFIDPVLVREERARLASAAPSSARGASNAAREPSPTGEPRTHLMLGPMILKDEPLAVLPLLADKPGWLTEQVRRLGFWVDDVMHARWGIALVAAALLCGFVVPYVGERGGAAARVLSLGLFVGLLAYGLTWLGKLRPAQGQWLVGAALARLRGSVGQLWPDPLELEHVPRHRRILESGPLLAGLGLFLVASGCIDVFVGSSWAGTPLYLAVRFMGASLLIVGVGLQHFAGRFRVVKPTPEELEESMAVAAQLAALVDLSESVPPSFIGGYTPLHRILVALTQWRGRARPDEASYRAALGRHFQRQLPFSKIESEKWLGRSRQDGIADLVIDDMVLIEIARGFHPASAARALSHVNDLARTWRGKPMLLVIFEGDRAAVFQSVATTSIVELHDRFPLVSVRMPAPDARAGGGVLPGSTRAA